MSSPSPTPEKLFDDPRWDGRLPSSSMAGVMLTRLGRRGPIDAKSVAGAAGHDESLTEHMLCLASSIRGEDLDEPETMDELVLELPPTGVRLAAIAVNLVSCNRVGVCVSFDYNGFWSRAVARGLAAMVLTHELEAGDPLEAFALGLTAEIGQLVLAGAYPNEWERIHGSALGLDAERVRRLEVDAFDVDSRTVTDAYLAMLGFHPSSRAALAEAFRSKEDVEVAEPDESMRRTRTILATAELMARVTVAGSSVPGRVWTDLVDLRQELGLERDRFHSIGDTVFHQWWEWGDRLRVPTEQYLTLSELAQKAVGGVMPWTEAETTGLPEFDPDAPLNVLVVDDDPMSLRILSIHLERGGHDVRTAVDGKDALLQAMQDTPDLIVADWVMPEIDGIELCRALRRSEAGRRIFFMIVTGREEESRIIQAFRAGVDDFLQKPVRPKPFLARICAAGRTLSLHADLERQKRMLREYVARERGKSRHLDRMSLTDVLTGLPNRRYAIKRTTEEWANSERTGKPMSAIMIDIDKFKSVNDTYGHDVGDVVLRETARVLEKNTRKSESACRLGGEEFVVICWDATLNDAAKAAERLRRAVETNHITCPGYEGSVTISLGVSRKEPGVRDMDHLLRLADEAVYRAKAAGRNRVVLSEGPEGTAREAG
jgi:diguanylate cyclase (GGDEF)-like protein